MLASKMYESYVLEWASTEVKLKSNQYGGVKGCSTAHMVIEIWQSICESLEDYRAAAVLTSIDYAKAFNRLSFQECLKAFAAKGASSSVIRLIATFLSNRTMSVRVGSSWSEPKPVTGGCPQGAILGVLLFNLTTDGLEDDFLEQERRDIPDDDYDPLGDERPQWIPPPEPLPGSPPWEGGNENCLSSSPVDGRGAPPVPGTSPRSVVRPSMWRG